MILPRMRLSQVALRRVVTVLDAPTNGFVALVRVAGLDPACDFRGAVLDGVDFGTDDLGNFDFSGADLRGADMTRATGLDQMVTDANTRLPDHASRKPPDFDVDEVHRMILAGKAAPSAWRPFITELDFSPNPFLTSRSREPFATLSDVAPLAGLTALQSLDLMGTKVSDVTPLRTLPGLQIRQPSIAGSVRSSVRRVVRWLSGVRTPNARVQRR
ncbi:MAG TPA: pentapeptide repeat-containing protein [Acetobacteraceae bacterium]|jgi:Leucine-rich repeat (LRR) protein